MLLISLLEFVMMVIAIEHRPRFLHFCIFLPLTSKKSNFLDNYKKFKDTTIDTFEAKTSAIPQKPKHLVQYLLMKNYTEVCESIL